MDKGKLKGHAALWVANLVWGLNAPIGKSVLWSEHNPGGVSPFALSVYQMCIRDRPQNPPEPMAIFDWLTL